MATTALFQSDEWAESDARAKRRPAEPGVSLPFLHELMDRVRRAIDAGDWPALALATEQILERTEAGEHDPKSPLLMIGRDRCLRVPAPIVERLEALRDALRGLPAKVPDPSRSRLRRAAPGAEARAAEVLNKCSAVDG